LGSILNENGARFTDETVKGKRHSEVFLKRQGYKIGIFGPKALEVPEGYRKVHNDELHKLEAYSPPSMTRVIKFMKLSGRGMWHAWDENAKYFGPEILRKEPLA
jgi:hypothetical protein